MSTISKLTALASLRSTGLTAALTWPCFSITSFQMLSKLVKQGIAPNTVIDVGANVGQFAVASARLFKPTCIYSFEPEPETFRRLSKNIHLEVGAVASQKALGERPGSLPLHKNSYCHSSSLLRLADAHKAAFPFAQEKEDITVEVSTLDIEFGGVTFNGPALLKLDVQGYEEQVLAGGAETLKRIDYLIMEVSFRSLYEGETSFLELLPKMQARGFELSRPVGWLEAPATGEILQMDALFIQR